MSEKILYSEVGDVIPVKERKTEFYADGLPAQLDSTSGDDILTGTKNADTFVYSGGNDTITNYSGEDTVKISSDKVNSYSFNDEGDLIFKVGSGSITLKYMKGRAITVQDSTGTNTKVYGTGYSGHDAIKNMVKAWGETLLPNNSTIKLDESVRLSSHFNSVQEVIDQMIADRNSCEDGDTFLRKYCGIVMDNNDSGGVTGWDAGGLSMISSDDIIGETLSTLQHLPDYKNSSVTTSQGVTVNISSTGGSSLTADAKKVLDGTYSWWAEESLKLIEESFGVKFEEGTEITFSLDKSKSHWGVTSGRDVKISMDSTRFYGDDDYNGNGVDMTIAHEFTHVAQNLFMGRFPQFLHEGFADLSMGEDNRSNKRYTLSTVADNADSLATYLDLDMDGTGTGEYYVAGFMFYRYFMRQASNNYDSTKTYAWSDKAAINGTSAAEFLTASGNSATITAGAGNDTITSYGDYMKVFGGDGSDALGNGGNYATLDGGAGDDSIRNSGDKVSVSGGSGSDTINNNGANVSISMGDGTDSIYNYAGGANSKILTGADNDTVFNSAEGVTIDGGADNDRITNQGNEVSISSGAGNDSIYNYGDSAKIFGNDGEDYIVNYTLGANSTIDGGADNDYIWNYGNKVSISGGSGDDYLQNYNSGTDVTISGGDGKDTVFNAGSEVSIGGGAGNDYIDNKAENATIGGGAGDNTISNSGKYATFVYEGGNDYIQGADATSTLQISDSFTSVASGSNLILTIANKGKITLVGAKDKGITVDDGTVENKWRLNGTTATYGTATKTLITITGVQSVDNFKMNGRQVTLPKSALGTSTITINDGYTLALADDDDIPVPKEDTPALTVNSNKTSATLKQTFTAGYTLSTDKRTITYSDATTGDSIGTISGLKKDFSVDDITVDSTKKKLVVSKNALGTSKVSVGKKDTYTLALESGEESSVGEPEWSVKGSAAYYIQTAEAGSYSLSSDSRSITCSTKPKTTTLATVSGLKKNVTTDDFYNEGNIIYLTADALGTSKVSVKGDYTLQLANGVSTISTPTNASWTIKGTTATYKGNVNAYYTLAKDKKSVIYYKPKANATLATISNLSSNATTNDISTTGKIITLAANALTVNAKKKTTLKADDYTLAIDSSLKSGTNKYLWTVDKKDAVYGYGKTAYYTLAEDGKTVAYSEASINSGNEYIWLSNLNSKALTPNADGKIDGITLSGATVTLSANVLNKKEVKMTGAVAASYKLALGSDVEKSTLGSAGWTHKSTTDTLIQTQSKGYALSGNYTITYTSKDKSNKIATVKGTKVDLSTTNAYNSSTNTVTLANAYLDTKHKVTISGTTKFNFASDFSKATITGSSAADTITVGGSNISISAAAGNDSISVAGSNVSINAGKGDDYVNMGTAGSNLFIYASGDGNDTIGNFSATDKIKVTKGTVAAAASGSDVILTVTQGKTTGKITVSGAASQSFSVYDSKDKVIATYPASADTSDVASSPDKLSDNYFDASPQLGEILGSSYDVTSADEFGTSYDATQLAKQTTVYGVKK